MASIEHVVVLMFENRSFDHLLGLLSDDPAYPGVRPGDERFGNPVDPYDPGKGRVPVTDDGTADLAFDPPHSHASVVEQTGLRRRGGPTMDGFVAAYSRKLHGDEEGLPIVHWGRIGVLVAALVAGVAAVLALPVLIPLIAGTVALYALVMAALVWAFRRRLALPVANWRTVLATPHRVAVIGAGLSIALGRWTAYGWRVLILALVIGAAGAVVVLRKRRKLRTPPPITPEQAGQIMRCMRPDQIPALAALADDFAVCTRWHCSVPGATWPNRNFVHAGTSDGTVDIEVGFYDNETVFHRLEAAGRSWRIYRDRRSLAQVMAFGWLTDDERIGNWHLTEDFAADVTAGRLAAYTFIEPCHDGEGSNSQHPGNNAHDRRPGDFARGDALVARIYEALRANPEVFAKTLLVVTYDEHGGFYDHVPPPTDAVAPAPFGAPRRSWLPLLVGWFVQQPDSRFPFTAYGPRVPAVVVSPLVPRRTWDDTIYDHSAVPRTVRGLFAPGTPPLSAREARSPSFEGLASLERPRTDLPDLSALTGAPEPGARTTEREAVPERDDEFARQLRHSVRSCAPSSRPSPRRRLSPRPRRLSPRPRRILALLRRRGCRCPGPRPRTVPASGPEPRLSRHRERRIR